VSKAPDRKVRSSSQSITSSVKVRSVRPHLLDERASTSDDSAHGGGPRSWAGPSRRRHAGERRTHRCMAAETVPPTSGHSDEMAGRVDRRVRNSGSLWRGDQPNVKRGSGPRCPLLSGSPPATFRQAPPGGRDFLGVDHVTRRRAIRSDGHPSRRIASSRQAAVSWKHLCSRPHASCGRRR
jgi:hypothetical protein